MMHQKIIHVPKCKCTHSKWDLKREKVTKRPCSTVKYTNFVCNNQTRENEGTMYQNIYMYVNIKLLVQVHLPYIHVTKYFASIILATFDITLH